MKKYILSLLVFFSIVSKTYSQAAILAMIFGDRVATEKFHLSVDFGGGLSGMNGLPQEKKSIVLLFGLGSYIKLGDQWALTPEFKPLSQRGAQEVKPVIDYASVLSAPSYSFVMNYFDMPVLAQYKINSNWFVSAGPQISFLNTAKQRAEGTLANGNVVTIDQDVKSTFNSTYISIPLEVGYILSKARAGKGMEIKFRYYIGVTDMFADNKYGSSKVSLIHLFAAFPFIKTKPNTVNPIQ